MNTIRFYAILILIFLFLTDVHAQRVLRGTVRDANTREPLPGASVYLQHQADAGTVTNIDGHFELVLSPQANQPVLVVSFMGFTTQKVNISNTRSDYDVLLPEDISQLQEVTVVSGSLKEVSKLESPVPIEVYTPTFFMKNPAPSLFESMSNINGVRPQLNCSVCNTGDIHINGLEGPYTMILIDGMPIVSGLSSVYGLTGIPASLIERVEIVKGPASTLYGSEAVAGLINVITKQPSQAPLVSVDVMGTSWGEVNTDVGLKYNLGPRVVALTGVNYFNYQQPADHNNDGFTDVTLQNRISVFNKLSVQRNNNRVFSIGARLNYEDRWGGEMEWTPAYRGSDIYYGESIYTKRWELVGVYQLPVDDRLILSVSANGHDQNSYYGTTAYMASQKIMFAQLTWNKVAGAHDLLTGVALRYTHYDDNTPATRSADAQANAPAVSWLPGVFLQDEINIGTQHKVLAGLRYDYNSIHGHIVSPRVNYKWSSVAKNDVVRLSVGNGYRVANVFTEDHAALTGARKVVFEEQLKPETSWNANMNYTRRIVFGAGFVNLDATAFYTRFNNKIVPDYTTNTNEIRYSNLHGHGVSRGFSLNVDANFTSGVKMLLGATRMDVFNVENNNAGEELKQRQLLTERFTAVWSISYPVTRKLTIDYTGNLYGPMDLPLLSGLDPRDAKSPVWSIQNIQLTYQFNTSWSLYGGVKNLLNYTPPANSIARAHDPFDKEVTFDGNGNALATPQNPYALTFDPSYVFAPNQGIRAFAGVRYTLN